MPAAVETNTDISSSLSPGEDFSDFLSLLGDEDVEVGGGETPVTPAEVDTSSGGAVDDDEEDPLGLAVAPDDQELPAVKETPPTQDQPDIKHVLDLSKRLAELQEANELRQQRADAERQKERDDREAERVAAERAKPVFDGDLGLTEEERTAYKDALPVLNKVARQAAEDMYQRAVLPLRTELEALRGRQGALDQSTSQTRAETFTAALRGAIPDLEARTASPDWQAYMAEPVSIPGMGAVPRAQAIQIAAEKTDLRYVVDQVRAFKLPTSPRPTTSVSPGQGQEGSPGTKARQGLPQKIRYSAAMEQLSALSEKARRGRIPLERYDKAIEAFETAVSEGRVDMEA